MKMNANNGMMDIDSVELKVIRVFLLAFVLLIVYQAIQVINIRRIDSKHREVLMVKHQSMKALEEILIQSSTIQRKLLNMAMTDDPAELHELEKIIGTAEKDSDRAMATLENTLVKHEGENYRHLSGLKEASRQYRDIYMTFGSLIWAGEKEKALEFRMASLRPAFESYQDIQQQMMIGISDDLIRQSEKVSSYTATSGWILFFLGLAPFIFATAKLLYLSVFLRYKSAKVTVSHKEKE